MAAGIALSQPALANKEVEAELMKQIKSAYVDGAYDKFNRLAAQMPEKSVFRPHVEIWQFRFFQKGVEKKFPDREVVWSKSEILPLLNKHESSWPAETLRRDWLEQLARTAQWDEFAAQRSQLRYRPDQGVECADLMYAAEQGQLVRYKLNAVLSADKRLPRTRRVMLNNLYKVGGVSAQDLDRHVLQLVANNQLSEAVRFVEDFSETAWGKAIVSSSLREATTNPDKTLKAGLTITGTDLYLTSALARRAVQDCCTRLIEPKLHTAISSLLVFNVISVHKLEE